MFTCRDGKGGDISSQASKMLYKPPGAVYIASYQKLDHWIMQFESFHWLSHHGMWAIIYHDLQKWRAYARFFGPFVFIVV